MGASTFGLLHDVFEAVFGSAVCMFAVWSHCQMNLRYFIVSQSTTVILASILYAIFPTAGCLIECSDVLGHPYL